MVIGAKSNAVTYFAFEFSAEIKGCTKQADISQMFKEPSISHTNFPVISNNACEKVRDGEEGGRARTVKPGDPTAPVVEAVVLMVPFEVQKCQRTEVVSDNLQSLSFYYLTKVDHEQLFTW